MNGPQIFIFGFILFTVELCAQIASPTQPQFQQFQTQFPSPAHTPLVKPLPVDKVYKQANPYDNPELREALYTNNKVSSSGNSNRINYSDPLGKAKDADFDIAFDLLRKELVASNYNFKKAVFVTEQAYSKNLDYESFDAEIKKIAGLCKSFAESHPDYLTKPLLVKSWAIKHVLADTIPVVKNKDVLHEILFTYDFDDMFGDKDMQQMFVSKLMRTAAGNCHSFPYLYKILASELGIGESAQLAYAPNHLFIRQKFDGIWWNLELTNGYFLQDYFMMATGYIHVPGIQEKIYMTPLTEKESIAACVMDLATYYEAAYGLDNFVLKCTQLALDYYPNCIQAYLMRANYWDQATRYHMQKNNVATVEEARKIDACAYPLTQLEATLKIIEAKGYIEVPEWKYKEWIESMKNEQLKRAGFK